MTIAFKADPLGFGDVEVGERQGAINYLKRFLLATGITDTDIGAADQVMDALDTSYPAWHVPTDFPNLVCVARHVRIMGAESTPKQAVVTLEYAARGEAEADYIISGAASLRQITSEKDYWGLPLSVSYTYPEDYPYDTALQGVTDTQGAEINVSFPNQVIRGTRYLQKANPLIFAQQYIDRLNLAPWLGCGIGIALCTDVTYVCHDCSTTPWTWKFTFEFLLDGSGHQPDVVYRDPNTGNPPADLVVGVGYYTADWYPYVDFNELFPTPDQWEVSV